MLEDIQDLPAVQNAKSAPGRSPSGGFFFGPDTRITLAYNNKRRLEKRINHRC
ncbi:hypothetical protein EaACW_2231 [Erwinia amylovora ACW56400]|uniref:Uncharacterized protein n=2 Tax=Erwinia amylovora TaxID=552 RepID=A0A830ZZE8_ERWAM|nr:hypothetical protein EaACW_2231 [Erwinia amylovora ACW56400]CBX81093.1 hypothetical protein predicted by Glimmer/Critica [Erwinia amylovora ATCC BAA-2158]CCO79075.1 hypothetical protein BN432_2287 [Erwinia amylovora Ea356]CCO82880.1 hypothetical protein BN433_2319 [Erwinia amylovora Ea266]CCO86651.1 hypothetical protein BN434_2272 [Erwinia amylovora CFBP 2585]CCO90440.1 hypothetical protein BN435_2280 [Erwinia amylovora 01SFR-BO]CCO94208.1 hypothetical protein BN437_2289 [Erwinia amylovora